jgi:hypothetical protein
MEAILETQVVLIVLAICFASKCQALLWHQQPLKVYVYDMTEVAGEPLSPCTGDHTWGCVMTKRLMQSKYYTTDGDAADYYLIPTKGFVKDVAQARKFFLHVRNKYPWWNQSVAEGKVKHIMVLQGK